MVDPRLCAEQLLLPGLVGEVPSHLVAVFLSLQRGDEMYPRPHLLAREFAGAMLALFCPLLHPSQPCCCSDGLVDFAALRQPRIHILVLPDSLSNPPESVCHEYARSNEVHGRSEAANGEVALVLDGIVPAHGGHILRHCGRCGAGAQWVGEGCRWRCGDVRSRASLCSCDDKDAVRQERQPR